MNMPTVALIGRPNTGKSTLFNRLAEKNVAIVSAFAGTTRDRVFRQVEFDKISTLLVDTAGLNFDKTQDSLELSVREQSEIALNEADLILFVVDSQSDLLEDDYKVAEILRKSKKPVFLIVSKVDDEIDVSNLANFFRLGFGDPIALSAIHNVGIEDLVIKIGKQLKSLKFSRFKITKKTKEAPVRLSFVGRPNVGKSSLINAILNKEQVIVSDIAGTTRDSVDLDFVYDDKKFVLTDTAGIRRSGKFRFLKLEKSSVIKSLKSIQSSDICVLVLDSVEKLTKQDMRVSEFVFEARKGLIIVLNKADLVKPEEKNRLLAILAHKMPYAHFSPVIFTSALKSRNLDEILTQALKIIEERKKQVKTSDLNYFLQRTVAEHPAKAGLKFKFVEQVDNNPPTFLFFVNKPDDVHFSYRRYLENAIRKEYGFLGTVIDLKFK